MDIKNEYPPNWHMICERFGPDVSDAKVVFTYGNTIYNPKNLKLTDHLIAHEEVHSLQQAQHPDGPDGWWKVYLLSTEFRVHQEAQAYGMQVVVGGKGKTREKIRNAILVFAKSLASPVYGSPCDLKRAQTLIKNYYITILHENRWTNGGGSGGS
jgi:hypothetical protein